MAHEIVRFNETFLEDFPIENTVTNTAEVRLLNALGGRSNLPSEKFAMPRLYIVLMRNSEI